MNPETPNADALREQLQEMVTPEAFQLINKVSNLEFSEHVAQSELFIRTLAAHLGDAPAFWLTVRHIEDTSTDRWDGCCADEATG